MFGGLVKMSRLESRVTDCDSSRVIWWKTSLESSLHNIVPQRDSSRVTPLLTEPTSGVHKKISWGFSFSRIWWSFLFRFRCLWRHNWTSYSSFQTNVLAMLLTHMYILLHAVSLFHVPLHYQRSKLGYRRKIQSTLWHNSSKLQNVGLRVETGK